VTTTYRVVHRTEYRYEADVSPSYSQLHLAPRDLPGQRCLSSEIVVDPTPDDYRERVDFFGNRVAFVAIQEAHRSLTVAATSIVEVDVVGRGLPLFADRAWEEVRDHVRAAGTNDAIDAVQFVLDSPVVSASPTFSDYAAGSFSPGRHLLEAVTDLSSRIHRDFEYKPGATSVRTTLDDVFAQRKGVCQDFAHVAIACLRSVGLPARYVSGYLETDPPPGRPKLDGADVSHAWFSVYVPQSGWVGVDPTNDQLVSDRYVTTAYGRDYSDVAPLNGVIFTEGRAERPRVLVDVVALAG
jgi:transglutaminase-like putative cysteine protease